MHPVTILHTLYLNPNQQGEYTATEIEQDNESMEDQGKSETIDEQVDHENRQALLVQLQ